jgi:hypothetical protein
MKRAPYRLPESGRMMKSHYVWMAPDWIIVELDMELHSKNLETPRIYGLASKVTWGRIKKYSTWNS